MFRGSVAITLKVRFATPSSRRVTHHHLVQIRSNAPKQASLRTLVKHPAAVASKVPWPAAFSRYGRHQGSEPSTKPDRIKRR